MGKTTKSSFVAIIDCLVGRLLLCPLAVVLLVVEICAEKLDLL